MITEYININAYFDYSVFIQGTNKAVQNKDLSQIFPPSIAQFELSSEKTIPIPSKVLEIYAQYRPTPIFRAKNFERAIGTTCEIYVKDESTNPMGNHKINSAYLISHLCNNDGFETISTETTGNWGIALAIAAYQQGVNSISFIDSISLRERPKIKSLIEQLGGNTVIVDSKMDSENLLELSADAAIRSTRRMKRAVYIFGSVYGYFVIPQTIIGLEAKKQLVAINRYPDFIIGSCGGGANFLGTTAAFLVDRLANQNQTKFISAESELCPILSKGRWGKHSIDNIGYYPSLLTYGLDSMQKGDYIGGLGSTIVASAVAHFHRRGLIDEQMLSSVKAQRAASLFFDSEGRKVALETAYQLAATINVAKFFQNKIILVNISA